MTRKNEKLPEVEAFEQAFDRPASRASSSFSRSQIQPAPAAAARTAAGQVSGASAKLRAYASSSSSWSPSPGQPPRRSGIPGQGLSPRRYQDDEDDEDEWEPWSARNRAAPPPPARNDGFSSVLGRLALIIVALIAAYSLQSHSRRQYVPGTIDGATVSNISYNAGWPLAYAHVNAQQVPLSQVDPTPAFHYISLPLLAADVVLLAVPLWLLLEAVWVLWVFVLERFGPRRLWTRLIALGFTALPATLWMAGALAAGIFLGFNDGSFSAFPKYLLPVLIPAAPGFGLAAAISLVLGVPASLWRLDFGVFLLTLALPLALLTIVLYWVFCLIGRGVRKVFRGEPEEPEE
ncbi:MAG TPA: hypothetical protein VKT82_16095 [Ktedonobacterales bacterium]|nr:hypothetical protein [Ktedonobacterales bacterium]